ncbi:glycosyltransferase family 4 protein [Parahaliea mediterranea]|uniref:Glycosyltransferase family 4 protein n=1 Tax=Parahaliea mediterranea TaxID=651086 RepID=A0A939DBM6_9GAMM|nr:glycosyltransferase family 4 protein [Parahaliea mediterranea]MBN7795185.1 glycosyltransferase family 4 protein [Parahaliea mediterranea]
MAGHRAEIVTIPFKWYPQQTLIDSMLSARLLDLDSFNGVTIDKVIALKFPLWLVRHPSLSLWVLHQHRTAYDLWDSGFSDVAGMPDGPAVREMIRHADNEAFERAESIHTISRTVSARLLAHNATESGVLYPPPRDMEAFFGGEYGDYFFFPSRITPLKRQSLVLEALAHTREPVRVVFAGEADSPEYLATLQARAAELGVDARVEWLGRVTEERKRELYAGARMVIFPPVDEDYGYITPEAMLSSRAVVTLEDAGGPTEFVSHDHTGLVLPADAEAIAAGLDGVWRDRSRARQMGRAARDYIDGIGLNWDTVLQGLL